MRKWRSPYATAEEDKRVVNQIVVPQLYKQEGFRAAHELPIAGNLGDKKNQDCKLQHYMPGHLGLPTSSDFMAII